VVLVAYRQGADHQRDRQGAEASRQVAAYLQEAAYVLGADHRRGRQGAEASRQVAVDFLDPLAEQ